MLDTIGDALLAGAYSSDPSLVTLYRRGAASYTPWATGEVRSMRVGDGMVTLSLPDGVVRYDATLNAVDTIAAYTWGPVRPLDAVMHQGTLWVGHEWGGLIGIAADREIGAMPQGPFSADNAYRLVPSRHHMLLCPGGHTTTYTNAWLEPNQLTATGSRWTSLDRSNGILDNRHDILAAAVNPRDTSEIIAVLWG